MHRTIAILLLLLVPLRVFGAELAGICMLEHASAQAQSMGAMPDDCPMMAQHEAPAGDPHHKPGADCNSCQLCMPLAAPDAAVAADAGAPPSSAPAVFLVHFASAEVLPSLRPPAA